MRRNAVCEVSILSDVNEGRMEKSVPWNADANC